MITAKVLEVTIECCDLGMLPYSITVYEFENGVILQPEDRSNDIYWQNRSAIEPHGNAFVVEVKESGEFREFTRKQILKSIQGSIAEYGVEAVPSNHPEIWKHK